MSVTTRPLKPADRDSLEAALRSAPFREDEVDVALELIDEAIGGSTDYRILVADVAGDVAGYVCYGPTPMTEATYDLYWIVTAAAHRGKGVASGLITAMEAALREVSATGVRVETSQLEGYGSARRLYERMGYPEAARLADFYRANDDLVVYYKKL